MLSTDDIAVNSKQKVPLPVDPQSSASFKQANPQTSGVHMCRAHTIA